MSEVEQVLRWVLEENRKEVEALSEALSSGAAGDYPRYTHVCGQVHALRKLNGALLDKLRQYMNGEE